MFMIEKTVLYFLYYTIYKKFLSIGLLDEEKLLSLGKQKTAIVMALRILSGLKEGTPAMKSRKDLSFFFCKKAILRTSLDYNDRQIDDLCVSYDIISTVIPKCPFLVDFLNPVN